MLHKLLCLRHRKLKSTGSLHYQALGKKERRSLVSETTKTTKIKAFTTLVDQKRVKRFTRAALKQVFRFTRGFFLVGLSGLFSPATVCGRLFQCCPLIARDMEGDRLPLEGHTRREETRWIRWIWWPERGFANCDLGRPRQLNGRSLRSRSPPYRLENLKDVSKSGCTSFKFKDFFMFLISVLLCRFKVGNAIEKRTK